MPNEKDRYTTSQLGIVAWFIYSGLKPVEMFREGSVIVWAFNSSEMTQSLIRQYNSDAAKVSPKTYNKVFSQTKTEMLAMKAQ